MIKPHVLFDLSSLSVKTNVTNSKNKTVFRVSGKNNKIYYRQKVISLNMIEEKQKHDFEKVVNTLIALNHPTINKIYNFSYDNNSSIKKIFIFSDFECKGSLDDIIRDVRNHKAETEKNWNATAIMKTIFGIAAGLMYVHGCRLIHKNIKSSNILFDNNYEPKIADFCFSKTEVDLTDSLIFEEHSYQEIPYYKAPELLGCLPINNKIDVYAYSIILYLLFMNEYPKFEIDDPDTVAASIMIGNRPELPEEIPKVYRELISECWANDCALRPSFKSIVRKLVEPEYILPGTNLVEYENYMKKVINKCYLLRKQRTSETKASIQLKTKADGGDPRSQFLYAKMLESGKEITPDIKIAISYFKKAADQGNFDALNHLAYRAERDQNWMEVEKYLKKASKFGNKEAQFHLAVLMKNGTGLKKNSTEAARLFKLAADQGDIVSQNFFADMLMNGDGVIQNKALAAKYYKRAANQGDKEAQFKYGNYLLNELHNPKEAKMYFFRGAKNNDINCLNALGDIFLNEDEEIISAFFYKLSSKEGSEIGKVKYHEFMSKGICSEQFVDDAGEVTWSFLLAQDPQNGPSEYELTADVSEEDDNSISALKRRADKGNPEAQVKYAKLLKNGVPGQLEPNAQMAVTYLQMSAEQEQPEGMLLLGEMLRDGIGIEKDPKKAVKWLHRSADTGNPQAMADYGYMRWRGIGFPNKKPEKALKYFELSAKQNNGDGMAYLAWLIKDQDPEKAKLLINESANVLHNATGEYLLSMYNRENGLEYKQLLQSSALKGNYEAQYELAILQNDINMIKLSADRNIEGACLKYASLISDKNESEALWYYTKAAENGDPVAEVGAARCLSKINPEKCEMYLRSAMHKKYPRAFVEMGHFLKMQHKYKDASHMYHIGAALKDTKGMLNYGLMYKDGLGLEQSYNKAYKYLKMSADFGDDEGMLQFALLSMDNNESIRYLKLAAEKGNNEARYFLAMSLKDEKKYTEAIEYLEEASHDHHEDSLFQLGVFYQNGLGVPADMRRAAQFYKEAAILPNATSASQFNYAVILKNGWGVPKNLPMAAKYFKLAALQGDSEAMNNYALLLNSGESGIKPNVSEAMKFFKMAADQGNSLAQNNYALLLKNSYMANTAELQEALKYFKMASDQGNYNAMNNYALMLKNGEGTMQDISEATRLFKIAADKGNNKFAMHNYALIIRDEYRDFQTSAKYSKMAADLGEVNAMNNYGAALKQGIGVEKNEKLALSYFKKAADLGHPTGMCNYANMLRDGCGIKQDLPTAIQYYQKAIDKGSVNALNCLALLYLTGKGVTKDREKAIELSKQAMDQGNRNGMRNYLRLLAKKSNSLPY